MVVCYLESCAENHKALATAAILITSSILSVGLYSLLIVSAYLRKPKAALPWLVLRAFGFLTDILVFILAIIAKDVFDAVVTPISMSKWSVSTLFNSDLFQQFKTWIDFF